MSDDPAAGWEAVADAYEALRSGIGTEQVQRWARDLPPGADILDIGCGTGWPIAAALAAQRFCVFGVDASPRLLAAFRRNLPNAETACEPVQSSGFFQRRFDAAIAIGLLFLLAEAEQIALIHRLRTALHAGGRFLFTAPRDACTWADSLTGRPSRSLGLAVYQATLVAAGFEPAGSAIDAGGNHYIAAIAV